MLEIIVDKRVIYVLAGGVTILGVICKMISNLALKRMMHGAENMSKSNHPLMRLVRAKFEHACMVSEKVENVQVFVDKYLYEHKTLGVRLHSWRRMEKVAAGLCVALGLVGAFLEYSLNGMNDQVIRVGAYGGILGVLLYLFHLTTDEKYRLEVTRNYMVDYLENVCLHKYEKLRAKEEEKKEEPEPVVQVQPVTYEPEREEIVRETVKETVKEALKEKTKELEKKEEKKLDKDVLIRQILEEFMA